MPSHLAPLLKRRAPRTGGRWTGLVRVNECLQVWRVRSVLLALLFIFCVKAEVAAAATTLSRYETNVRDAVVAVTALEQSAKSESQPEQAARLEKTLNYLQQTLPAEEMVEWEGGRVRVNNSWLVSELEAYRKMSPSDAHRAEALARTIERLRALEDRLTELNGQRKTAVESKDREKARLEEILRRDEFVEKPQEENLLARMWRRFVEWWSSLFPKSSGLMPGQMGWASFIALIIVFGLAAGVIAYGIWKLVPFFERRRVRLRLERGEARVVLGERVAPDQTAAGLMSEAESLAGRGEIRAAIRKAYIAVLCELGDRKVLTLSQHKTNRDYLRALREKRPL
ncbi:MAG TPA: hypothetical protein VEV81_11405, partial [Pyrinomonadaceae bacterium]|nr:hypothetical protein [Pyrinomonadaceae bacterium]